MPLIHKIDHPAVEGIRVGKMSSKGNYRINTSCIIYRLGDTIIDTGPTREWKTIKQYLSERTVKHALLTHYHEDHSGNCGHLQQCFNSVIQSHTNNHDRIRHGFSQTLTSKFIFGTATVAQPSDFGEQFHLDNGRVLQPSHMPGHSDDMTTFYEPNEGWLFSGDLYVSSQVRYAYQEENIAQQINSLNAALELDFKELFCAHRGYIAEGREALKSKRDFLVTLRDEVQHLHNTGLSPRAIARNILGREDSVSLFTGFAMSKLKLVQACLKS